MVSVLKVGADDASTGNNARTNPRIMKGIVLVCLRRFDGKVKVKELDGD